MTSFQPDLDFNDANDFLSVLLGTIPAVDKLPAWDFGLANPMDLAPLLFPTFELASDADSTGSEPFNAPFAAEPFATEPFTSQELSLEFTSQDQEFPSLDFQEQFNSLQFPLGPGLALGAPRLSSVSMASYSDLASSHFHASAEHTPVTSELSAHALPVGKKEMPLASLEKTLLRESDSDAESPRLRAAAKDKVSKPAKKLKVSHNMIEKKYRTNINSKILELRDAVPTLRIATGKKDVSVADLEGLVPASKLNKASVLIKATEYIKHLERKNDLLNRQIALLQTLVADASLRPTDALLPRLAARPDSGFGFSAPSYNSTVSEFLALAADPMAVPAEQTLNSTAILGGMATLMGGSFITEDTFRGMAAVPFIPQYLFAAGSSPVMPQFVLMLRYGVMALGAAMMLQPVFRAVRSALTLGKTHSAPPLLSWLLVAVGLQLPKPLSPAVRQRVIDTLLGKRLDFSVAQLYTDYATLTSSEVTFENCFLCVLIGSLLVKKASVFSSAIGMNMRWRGNLLMNLSYAGDDANLGKLNKLIKGLDGLNLFESDTLLLRLSNMAEGRAVDSGIKNGENHVNCVEVNLSNKNDIYGLLLGWRILDITHELTLAYLETLSSESDDALESIKSDVTKVEALIQDNAKLMKHFALFKLVVSPEATPELMINMRSDIVANLNKVTAYLEGQELTDDETFSDDSSSTQEGDHDSDTVENETTDPLIVIRQQGSMVYSLNLINEEKFIVLTTSLISYYMQNNDHKKVSALLQYLKFKDSKVPLSLLSFTCLVKLLSNIVQQKETDDAEDSSESHELDSEASMILESLAKMMRSWLNESNKKDIMTRELRSNLSNLVMTKGIALSDI